VITGSVLGLLSSHTMDTEESGVEISPDSSYEDLSQVGTDRPASTSWASDWDDDSPTRTERPASVSWANKTTYIDPIPTQPSSGYDSKAYRQPTSNSAPRGFTHGWTIVEGYAFYPGRPDFQDSFYRLHYSNDVTTYTIQMNDTISSFVASELDGYFPCNLVVLSGSLYNTWATTCEEYVNKTWPRQSHAILRLFELLGEMKPGATVLNKIIDTAFSSKDRLEVTADLIDTQIPLDPDTVLTVHLTARPSDVVIYLEAIAWLHTVLQTQEVLTSEEERSPTTGNIESQENLPKVKPLDSSKRRAAKKAPHQPNQQEVTIQIAPGDNTISLSIDEKAETQTIPHRKGLHSTGSLISAKSAEALRGNTDEKGGRKPRLRKDKDGYRTRSDTKVKQVIDIDPLGTPEIIITGGKPLRTNIGIPAYVEDDDLSSRDEAKSAEWKGSRNITSGRGHNIGRDEIHKRKAKVASTYSGTTYTANDETPDRPPYVQILSEGKKTRSGEPSRSRSHSYSRFTPEEVLMNSQRGGVTNVTCILMLVPSSTATRTLKLQTHLEALVSSYGERMVSSCWLSLVPNTAIASSHTSPGRAHGIKGLEVSFDLMCYLCGIEYEIIDNNGVVLFGHSSIVYPVRAIDDSLEWHFRPAPKREQGSLVLHESRLRIDDLDMLREYKRHFLGLWADPIVTLGTESSDVTKIGWTTAREKRQEYIQDGRSIGGTFNLPKFVGFTGTQTYRVAKSRKSPYMAGAMDFMTQLDTKVNEPVILYSVNEKRAWMVSFVSVLLHLGRARARNQSRLGFHIDACEEAADGGLTAFEHIRKCRHKPLKIAAENEILDEEEKNNTVQDYLKLVWAALDQVERERHKAKGVFRDEIIGYEMADIAYWKSKLHMKCHPLAGFRRGNGWSPLLDEIDIVLFYEGVDDPIKSNPARTQEKGCLGDRWTSIPKGFDILTVSLPCLAATCQRFNPHGRLSYLTVRHTWHTPAHSRQVFGNCGCRKGHPCNKLQELREDGYAVFGSLRAGNDPATTPSQTDLQAHPSGAVIFRYSDDITTIENVLESRWPGYTRIESNRPEPSLVEEIVTVVKPPNQRRPDSGYSSGSQPHPSSPAGPSSPRVPQSTAVPSVAFDSANALRTHRGLCVPLQSQRRESRPQPTPGSDEELEELTARGSGLTIISGEDPPSPALEDTTRTAASTPRRPRERQRRHRQAPRQRSRSPRSRRRSKQAAECCVM
jgi:hypothetical protein